MEKFQQFIEKHLIPITEKIGGQRHLRSVRDGVIHTLPLILIGSFFLLLISPPVGSNTPLLRKGDFSDWSGFIRSLDESTEPGISRIREFMDEDSLKTLKTLNNGKEPDPAGKKAVIGALNKVIESPDFYSREIYGNLKLRGEGADLAEKAPDKRSKDEVKVLNRLVFVTLYKGEIKPYKKGLNEIIKPYRPMLLIPFRFTFGIISLFVAMAVAHSLARSYKMEGVSAGILSLVIFLMTATPRVMAGNVLSLPRVDKYGWSFPIKYYGSDGLFLAIIIAIVVVELLRFLKNKKLMFTMPEGVPEGVTKAFEAIIPAFLIILLFWTIRDILKIDIPEVIIALFSPIKKLGDSLVAVLILTITDSIVWFAGIHPVSIIGPFARPVWLTLLEENARYFALHGRGAVLPRIAVDQFYFWFMWVGGSGATLGLVFHLLFAKSKFLRQLGKMCLLPGLFNINEPLVFGLPIVANPLMIIPFTLAPMVGGTIAYVAFLLNLVQRPYIEAPWTLPAPFGALVSTGFDWRACVLSIIVIIISAAIYYPFFKIYDRQMAANEEAEEDE